MTKGCTPTRTTDRTTYPAWAAGRGCQRSHRRSPAASQQRPMQRRSGQSSLVTRRRKSDGCHIFKCSHTLYLHVIHIIFVKNLSHRSSDKEVKGYQGVHLASANYVSSNYLQSKVISVHQCPFLKPFS